jgi:exodeoxyribonuclease VII large subunit
VSGELTMSDAAVAAPPERRILTPSALNRLVRDLLGDALPRVWVEGELSNVARPASGHLYFTLKDARAQIRCAMFKPQSTWLKFRPGAGDKVLVRARVGLYEARGDYQLVVEHMEPAGAGALQREFEELKARLSVEGLFAETLKKPLPRFARRIGVITSASGAAIRDVLNVLGRRFPLAEVEVLPVPVQGIDAPPAIVAMLRKANAAARHDVLLVTRGGGSLEDLAAFNDEAVARAIHASAIPVVSAVGHEIDFTISDFVADLRAPTPSAAAELLVPDATELLQGIARQRRHLADAVTRALHTPGQRLDHLQARLQAQSPHRRLAQGRERLHMARARLRQCMRQEARRRETAVTGLWRRLCAQHPRQQLAREHERLGEWRRRLRTAMMQQLTHARERLEPSGRALHAVSPLATLERGYAILLDDDGHVIRSAQRLTTDAEITARLADGTLRLKRLDPPSS